VPSTNYSRTTGPTHGISTRGIYPFHPARRSRSSPAWTRVSTPIACWASRRDQIQKDTGIRPCFALEAFPDLDDDVRQSIARIKASPFVPRTDRIRGFVFDVVSGQLREVT
jgi:carbonic anhydrase